MERSSGDIRIHHLVDDHRHLRRAPRGRGVDRRDRRRTLAPLVFGRERDARRRVAVDRPRCDGTRSRPRSESARIKNRAVVFSDRRAGRGDLLVDRRAVRPLVRWRAPNRRVGEV